MMNCLHYGEKTEAYAFVNMIEIEEVFIFDFWCFDIRCLNDSFTIWRNDFKSMNRAKNGEKLRNFRKFSFFPIFLKKKKS